MGSSHAQLHAFLTPKFTWFPQVPVLWRIQSPDLTKSSLPILGKADLDPHVGEAVYSLFGNKGKALKS